MKVWEVIKKNGRPLHTAAHRASVTAAIVQFVESEVRALVVVNDGGVAGILTVRDVLKHIARHGGAAVDDEVSQVMTRDVTSIGPEAKIEDVEKIFAEKPFNHIPVLQNSKLIGMLTPADVFASHLRDVQGVNDRLMKYISGGYH